MKSPSTPRDFVEFAERRFGEADLFYGHGTDNPHDEAVYLVLRGLQLPFDIDDVVLDSPLDERQQQYLKDLVARRIRERMPVAYLINEAWFAGMRFFVDQRVLIPRSPLAELIESGFSPWVDAQQVNSILDIGTGSGCIAIACAMAFAGASVDATDVEDKILEVARMNIDTYHLLDRIQLHNSYVFRSLPQLQYDLIVSNPPYVNTSEMKVLPAEYRHEPVHGLQAGEDGLAVVKEILRESRNYLSEHGVLIVEVGNSQEAVMNAFPELPFTWLEFEHGGEGVFLLTADELCKYQHTCR